jgi:hypothetical protein
VPRDNAEIVRRYLESAPGECLREFWEADGDYYPVRKFPEARPCHGREEIIRFIDGLAGAWSSTISVKDAVAVGDDRVVAQARLQTEGRASGLSLDGDIYYCFWLRHGRFIRQEDHLTAKGALHAVGLNADTLDAARAGSPPPR